MSWLATPWGYDVGEELDPFVSSGDFYNLTGGRYASDERVTHAIEGCCAAIRKHCGWHVAGSVACRAVLDGGSTRIWLPANHVSAVTSVRVCGESVTDYEWSRQGELRIPRSPDVLSAIEVEYEAGLPEAPDDLVELVKRRVERMVSSAYGVTQETAGNVTISYAQNVAADAGGSQLNRSDMEALAGYRLVEAM